MMTANEVKNQMNHMAQEGKPFLFAVDYEMNQGFLIQNPLTEKKIKWRVGIHTNVTTHPQPSSPTHRFTATPITREAYQLKFNHIQQHLHQGNSFLTNLTVRTPIEMNYGLEEIFDRSNSPYALYYPERFVCFSPEIFVRISSEGVIRSFPMKGTIDATLSNAPELIRSNPKEAAEHFTVVDLIRSDLAHVATDVNVERLRFIDQVTTSKGPILQVSSEIKGRMDRNWKTSLGDAIWKLLPAGSITGAPKPATIRAIAEAEGEERGFYTGVFGYFDGESLDTAVMIRYIEQTPEGYFFRSGGGITVNSQCEDEYEEVLKKVYLPF